MYQYNFKCMWVSAQLYVLAWKLCGKYLKLSKSSFGHLKINCCELQLGRQSKCLLPEIERSKQFSLWNWPVLLKKKSLGNLSFITWSIINKEIWELYQRSQKDVFPSPSCSTSFFSRNVKQKAIMRRELGKAALLEDYLLFHWILESRTQ